MLSNQTLKTKYKEKQSEIKIQVDNIKKILKIHEKLFNESGGNWGYVGDLARIKSILSELDGFNKSEI